MSNPNPVPDPAPRRFAWFAVAALLGYAVFLGVNFSPVAGGSDSSGYLNAAQLLASGRLTAPQRDFGGIDVGSSTRLQPLGFIAEPARARLVPTYPLGLPAHLAVAGRLFGWTAGPLVVGVGAALAAMLLLYAVARQLDFSRPLAALGAVLFGAFPVTVFIALQPLSDVLATAWVLAAFYAALRARVSPAWGFAAGAALAVAVFVRPTNVLVLPALAVVLLPGWRAIGALVLGGLPGALLLLAANAHLFGSPWRMGYVSIFDTFLLSNAAPTSLHFAKWLGLLLPGLVPALALCGFGFARCSVRLRLALVLWFAVPVGVYACYEFSREVWWSLRFVLPAVPALVLAALAALDRGLRSRPRLLAASAAILALWAVGISVQRVRDFHVLLTKTYEQAYAEVGVWARERLPADTVVAANNDSGALYYYAPFPVLRWDQMSPAEFAAHAAHYARTGRPLHLVVHQSEEAAALAERAPARWEKIAAFSQRTVWRYAGPAP